MLLLKIAAVFAMGTAVGAMYRVPRSLVLYGGLNAALSWLVTYYAAEAGLSIVAASFSGAVAVGVAAELLARVLRTPATIFIIPGFIPLVPGREAYTTMRLLVEGLNGEAMAMAVLTFLTAGAIAFGIFVSVTVYRLALSYMVGGGTNYVERG